MSNRGRSTPAAFGRGAHNIEAFTQRGGPSRLSLFVVKYSVKYRGTLFRVIDFTQSGNEENHRTDTLVMDVKTTQSRNDKSAEGNLKIERPINEENQKSCM